MEAESLKLGQVLLKLGLINDDQLLQALTDQKGSDKKLGEILVGRALLSEDDLLQALADFYQLSIVDLAGFTIDHKLLAAFPKAVLVKHKVLPLEIKDENLILATNDPLNVGALQEIRYISGRQIKPVLASLADINLHLSRCSESMDTLEAIRKAQDTNIQETPILKLVNSILSQAIREGASDIHLEPQKESLRVRFRIDGILFTKLNIPLALHRKVVSRLKIMSGMDVAESRKPQDGRMAWKEEEHNFDIRVSSLLDMHGEALALRLLNKKAIAHTLNSLGLSVQEVGQIESLVGRPHGIFLVTGPTGAGKTTTLYSVLNYLNKVSTNIITVEDPVEYQLDGITQTNINPHVDYTFSNAIRHILRHDPDIIMVGEIRDMETAEVSVRAALTGHLVLATLHTNSAAGAITRLIDMNVEPFLLSSTVTGVIAQRLVRKLCPHCKKEGRAAPEIEQAICSQLSVKGPLTIAQPVGCERCFHTGYAGRVGLFEILMVTEDVRKLVLAKANEQEITKAQVSKGMKTLRMAGYQRVVEKVTSYDEVLRTTLEEEI